MNILHIIYSMTIGGTENMLVDIVNEQCKTDKISIIVINNLYSHDLLKHISSNVNVYFINRKIKSRNPFDLIKLNVYVKKISPEIINVHNESIINYLFCKNTPICRTVHCLGSTSKTSIKYDALIAISKSVNEDIKGKIHKNSVIISNGVNFKTIKFDKTTKQKKDDIDVFRIVQIGRLDINQKGQDLLLQALKILIKKKNHNIIIDFIGEGKSETELLSFINKAKLQPYVNFLGVKNREYIYEKLQNYDLLVQPSREEGFGLTVAEAMGAKLPVLVSNVNGPMEIIKNGKHGFFFISENIEDLANQIEKIIKREIRTDVEANRKYILENYGIVKTVNEYKKLYEKMILNKKQENKQ